MPENSRSVSLHTELRELYQQPDRRLANAMLSPPVASSSFGGAGCDAIPKHD